MSEERKGPTVNRAERLGVMMRLEGRDGEKASQSRACSRPLLFTRQREQSAHGPGLRRRSFLKNKHQRFIRIFEQ